MRARVLLLLGTAAAALVLVPAAVPAQSVPGAVALCNSALSSVMSGAPSSEPLAPCQWDMAQIHASSAGSYGVATG